MMNTNKTKQLRRSITASVAAFTFGTCVLSTSYATAAPTGAETLTVEDSAPEPEAYPLYWLIGGVGFAVGFAVGFYNYEGKANTPSVQIPIQTPLKGGVKFIYQGKTPQMSAALTPTKSYTDEFLD